MKYSAYFTSDYLFLISLSQKGVSATKTQSLTGEKDNEKSLQSTKF